MSAYFPAESARRIYSFSCLFLLYAQTLIKWFWSLWFQTMINNKQPLLFFTATQIFTCCLSCKVPDQTTEKFPGMKVNYLILEIRKMENANQTSCLLVTMAKILVEQNAAGVNPTVLNFICKVLVQVFKKILQTISRLICDREFREFLLLPKHSVIACSANICSFPSRTVMPKFTDQKTTTTVQK